MATTQISRTDLVSVDSVAYIRPMNISFSVTDTKPNTRLYAFFDGVSVDAFVTPGGGSQGGIIRTDATGRISGLFYLPPLTFRPGIRKFRLQDNPSYSDNDVPGTTMGSATGDYTTDAIKRTWQDTITTITTVNVVNTIINEVLAPAPPPAFNWNTQQGGHSNFNADPLAQSFFTYGVVGGCFITAIDIYFQSKDANLPVILEIRELVNGYPGPNLANSWARVSKIPANVLVSNNSSLATTFTFDRPVYLGEDKEWCFVLLANTNAYNVWTSTMGQASVETGLKVYEQPFIGSLFKSENNTTWTAYQDQDIKFTMYRAKFDISVKSNITMKAKANAFLLYGTNCSVTSGSPLVLVNFDTQHGLRTNDYISITPKSSAAVSSPTFRGITAAQLTGDFAVTILDDYNVTFNAGGNATSTGTLQSQGKLNTIIIDSGGSNYSNPSIVFTGGGATTSATATPIVTGGVITSFTITNYGVGYTSTPTITITDTGSGTGASLVPITDTIFSIETNNLMHRAMVLIGNSTVPYTKIDTKLKTTDVGYNVGSAKSIQLSQYSDIGVNSMLVSTKNTAQYLPGQNPTEVTIELSTSNENVSPILVADAPKLSTIAYVINNQTSLETLTATAGSAYIVSYNVSSPGSGYSGAPAVTISAPDLATGTQATAHTTVAGTAPNQYVTGVVVDIAGSGYTTAPKITIATSATTAAAAAVLSPFNTELLSKGGTAYSKYITKPIGLETISSGARVYVNAMSMSASNFDVYLRTSLSSAGLTHKNQSWSKMNCDLDRNLSKSVTEYLDYTFYLDSIPSFDVYDLKIVFRSTNKAIVPVLSNYRAVILST